MGTLSKPLRRPDGDCPPSGSEPIPFKANKRDSSRPIAPLDEPTTKHAYWVGEEGVMQELQSDFCDGLTANSRPFIVTNEVMLRLEDPS